MIDRRVSAAIRLIIGIGLIAWLGFSGAIEWSALLGLVESWPLSLAALALLFFVMALIAWRLRVLLNAKGLVLGFGASFRLTLIGAFFSTFLPGSAGGDVARVYLAARPNRGHRTEIATIILLDRGIGFFALLVLPLLVAFALSSSYQWPASVQALLQFAGIAALVLSFAILTARSHGSLRRLLIRVLGWVRLGGYAERFLDTLYVYRYRQGALLGAFFISLANQALLVVTLLLLARVVGAEPLGWGIVIIIPFGMLANSLPLTPGGLGVGEAAFAALFWSVGATGGAETLLAWRVLTTAIGLTGGVLLLVGRTDMSMVRRMTAATVPDEPESDGIDDRPAGIA